MSALRFMPHMTLQAAARIAHQHGRELRVTWNGRQAVVEAVKIHDDADIPAFLRPMADPSGGSDFERVVTLKQFGAAP